MTWDPRSKGRIEAAHRRQELGRAQEKSELPDFVAQEVVEGRLPAPGSWFPGNTSFVLGQWQGVVEIKLRPEMKPRAERPVLTAPAPIRLPRLRDLLAALRLFKKSQP